MGLVKRNYVVVTLLVETDAVVASLPDLTSQEILAWLNDKNQVRIERIEDAVPEEGE